MLVVLDDSSETININRLEKISSDGKDGVVYRYGNLVVKIPTSGHMTVEKLADLKKVALKKSRLILPLDKGQVIDGRSPREFGIAFTTRYIERNPTPLENIPTDVFLEESHALRDEIQDNFTPNDISILDTNPKNVIVSGDGCEGFTLNLIDHDRNVTPTSSFRERQMVSRCGYDNFNDKKFAQIMYKLLLLELLRSEELKEGKPLKDDNPVGAFVIKEAEALRNGYKTVSISDIEGCLSGCSTVSDALGAMKRREL